MEQFKNNTIRILFLAAFAFIMFRGTPMLWLAIFALSMVAAVFFGRFYCGWICPMNTMMIGTEKLALKFGIKLKSAPKWIESGWLAWVLLIVSAGLMIFMKKVSGKDLPVLLIWLVASVILTFRYKPEVFHNKICLFGVLQGLTGRYAFSSRRVDPIKCIGCKLCEKACPAEAIKVSKEDHKAKIDTKLCHQCYNCTLVCPKEAIDYGKVKK
jgi:ferredoxin-type protein NapH